MNQFNISIDRRNLFVVHKSALTFHIYNGEVLVAELSASIQKQGYEWVNNSRISDDHLNTLIIQAIERYLSK
jgi:hypothetical protein